MTITDLLTEENTGHREGCAFGRTARCNCTYLKQWDRHPEYTAPAFPPPPGRENSIDHQAAARTPTYKLGALSGKPLTTPEDIMAELDQLRQDITLEDAATISANGRREQPAPFPMEEKDYYPTIDKAITALTVDGEIWEPRQLRLDEKLATKYWHGEYKDLRRRFIGMFAIALAGWAFSIARGVWGF